MDRKEIKSLLSELELEESDLDFMWEFCVQFDSNPIISELSGHGLTWRDLNSSACKTLPDVYSKALRVVLSSED